MTGGDPGRANPDDRELLIVRHGQGRGRKGLFLDDILAIARHSRPELVARTRLYETGNPIPDVSGVAAVFFWLGDPLKEMYPDCYEDAARIAELAEARGARLINPPDALSNAIKSRQSEIWRKHGIPCARAWPAPSRTELLNLLDGLRFPVVLRYDEGHTQRHMFLCRGRWRAMARVRDLRYPAVALEFIDVRKAWRATGEPSMCSEFYHKKRAMVFGDAVFNNHLVFSKHPLISSNKSLFGQEKLRRNKLLRMLGLRRSRLDEAIKEDVGFALNTTEHAELLSRAVKVLGLQIAAVDYAGFPNGDIIVWEANPYFHLRHWASMKLGGGRSMDKRNPRFYYAAIDLLASAVGLPDRPGSC